MSPPLSTNRDFRWFWYGQAVSSVGDGFALVALPLLVLDATSSVAQMGIVTALAACGQIVMSLFAGVLLDRVNRRHVMIGTDLARVVLFGALPFLWVLHSHRLALVYVVAFVGAALGNLFSVGQVAAIANLVERDDLAKANSRLQATSALAYVIGPMLAGIMCARFGTASALWADAASFGVSAASLWRVRFGSEERRTRTSVGMFSDLIAGLRFSLVDPVIRRLLVYMSGVGLLASAGIGAAVIDLFVFHLRTELHESGGVVGLCLGVAALGALAGAIGSPRVRERWGVGACLFGGTALQAFGMIVGALLPFAAGTLVAATFWAAGLTTRAVANISLRQERAPDHLLGRVSAAAWTCTFAASSVGAIVVTNVAASIGAARALGIIGIALAIVAAAGAKGLGASLRVNATHPSTSELRLPNRA